MELKHYYQIFNVSQNASAEDINKAFRRSAMRCHPDRNPENNHEAGEKFKEINEAYEVLGNEQIKQSIQHQHLVRQRCGKVIEFQVPYFTEVNQDGKAAT